jgi:hypothetical protein
MMSSTTPGSDPEAPRDAEGADRDPDDLDRHADVHAEGSSTGEPARVPDAAASDRNEPAAPDAEPEPVAEPDRQPVAEPETAAERETVAESASEPESARADETARLDAALGRASTLPAADQGDLPEPVAADSVRRETYVPASTAAATGAAGAATLAPDAERGELYVAPQPGVQTIYVQAPTPPRMRGNRGFGIIVALVGTVLFALLYAGVSYLLFLSQRDPGEAADALTQFLMSFAFWAPVVMFFVGFALLAVVVNRGAWWYYAVFGLLVAVLVYLAYLGGALATVQAWTRPVEEVQGFIGDRWFDPLAIVAFIIAREIPVWLGGWIASRGRAVGERNRLAREAYDRELAAGPQPQYTN